MDIAACTTATGRKLIVFSKKFCESNYKNTRVVYGDSVTGDTPLIVKNKVGEVKIKRIDEISQYWHKYDGFKAGQSNRREKQQSTSTYQKIWSDGEWVDIKRVIRHKTNKKLYRVSTAQGCVDVTEDHSLLDHKREKLKPKDCQIGTTRLLHSFPTEFSEPCTVGNIKLPYESYDKVDAQNICYKLRQQGKLNIRVNVEGDKYLISCSEKILSDKITGIQELPDCISDTFVYDIETENGRFNAGVGQLCVKNTDSLFVKFSTSDRYGNKLVGLDAIYKSIELCIESAGAISRQLKPPHNLEFEKAIWPFILVSKKRYHGHYYTNYGYPSYYSNSMGIVLKRRDNAKIVKHVFGGMTDIIMKEHSIPKAINFIKEECKKMLDGEFPMDYFIITKTLRSYYKSPDQIAHNVLAQRIGKRDPGNKPQGNDRIPYAYIRVANQDCLQGDRIETPEYISEHKLKLDYRFYLMRQIIKPVAQILELVIHSADPVFKDIIIEYDNALLGATKINDERYSDVIKFFKPKAISTKKLSLRYRSETKEPEEEFEDDTFNSSSDELSDSDHDDD